MKETCLDMTNKEYWNERYLKEGKIWGEKPSKSSLYALKLFKKYKIKNILIPGSGYGRHTKFFSENNYSVVGIEISKIAIEIAKIFDVMTTFFYGSVLKMDIILGKFDAIYSFNTLFDTTTVQGNFKGKPVGVEYIGTDFKTVTLSFPLYYMDQMQAQELIDFIMVNKFNEIVSVKDEDRFIPDEHALLQNYPNPFNPSTKMKYSLPQSSNVVIKVFDILGNEIETLVDEEKLAGTYEITWYANNLPSGIYLYQLRTGDFVETKKMVLMK